MKDQEKNNGKATMRSEGIPNHPAKYSPQIIELIRDRLIPDHILGLGDNPFVLDPFGGVGGVFAMTDVHPVIVAAAVEIQRKWAISDGRIAWGNFLNMTWREVDAVITSPAYGNRMADHHEAADDSRRITYRHSYGEPLSDGNAGKIQWGDSYRTFHVVAWDRVHAALRVGGIFILNVSDHIRGGQRQRVTAWHKRALTDLGFTFLESHSVKTPRMGFGQNSGKRVDSESVLVFRKDGRRGFYAPAEIEG